MKKKLLPLTFLAFLNLLNGYHSEAQTTPCELANKQHSKSEGSGTVNHPKRAVDDDLLSYSSLTVVPGHTGDVAEQKLKFAPSGSAGDSIYVKLSFPFSVTNIATLSNISLATFDGHSFNHDRVSLNSSYVKLSWQTSNEAIAKVKAPASFDRLEIRIKSAGNGKASSVKVFYANTIVQRPALSVAEVEICAGYSATLNVLGPEHATFNWYTTSVGGSSLHSGASFNTPVLFSDAVYYVESSRNGCANSLRTPVLVKVIQPQPAVKQWDKTYGAPSTSEMMNSMIAAPGGKYHIWYFQNISYPNYKLVHLLIDSVGNQIGAEHSLVFSGGNPAATIQTPDGGFLISEGNNDIKLTKIDSTFSVVWTKTFGGSSMDLVSEVKVTPDGGFLVGGYTFSNDGDVTGGNGDGDYWVIKLDGSGNKQWDKASGWVGDDAIHCIQIASDGGYLLGGHTSPDFGYAKAFLIKTDIYGNEEWRYGDSAPGANREVDAIHVNPDGSLLLGGMIHNYPGSLDLKLVKATASGAPIWQKVYGGSDNDYFPFIVDRADGGWLIGSYTYSNDGDVTDGNNGEGDMWIFKIDSLGNKEWDKTFGGSHDERLLTILPYPSGGYLLGGFSSSNDGDVTSGSAGDYGVWILKIGSQGCTESLRISSESTSPESEDKVNSGNNIVVYPNPFISRIQLDILVTEPGPISVNLYTSEGRLVASEQQLVSDKGAKQITLETGNVGVGVYLCKIVANNKVYTQKLVKTF